MISLIVLSSCCDCIYQLKLNISSRKLGVSFKCPMHSIRYFWDVVLSFSLDLKKKLLLFATGSDRVPIGGMGEMEFKIIRMEVAHSTSM